jgi:hypothetical protein
VAHRAREVGVHREPRARPVEGAAEPPELAEDRVPRLAPPRPDPLDELLASEIRSADTLLRELALDHHLRGDAGVVGARDPEDAHPLMRFQRARMSSIVRPYAWPMWSRPVTFAAESP